MIYTFVVEDEPVACRRICRLIEASGMDFKIVGTASDGEEALETLKDTPCDLIFTDIRMPVMDGIEFIKHLRQIRSTVMIVVVSGYADFGYATEALRTNVVDYLLKPVAEDDMRNLLRRIKKLFSLQASQIMMAELSNRINKAIPNRNNMPLTDVDKMDFYVALFCAGAMPMCENMDMCPGYAFWNRIHFSKILESCFLNDSQFAFEFMGETSVERIVIIQSCKANVQEQIKSIHSKLLEQANIPISCISCVMPISIDSIDSMLRILRDSLFRLVRIGQSLFITSSSENTSARTAFSASLLKQACELLMCNQTLQSLSPLFSQFEAEGWAQKDIAALFFDALIRLKADNRIDSKEEKECLTVLKESFSAALTLLDVQNNISGICIGMEDADSVGNTIDLVVEYLETNYSEHITCQTLSTRFGYVPSYLSLLFRREKNMSPVEYLTIIRMKHARELLMRDPEMRIRDVAENVGFKNQYHFSRTFKKYEGVSPTDYRQANGGVL